MGMRYMKVFRDDILGKLYPPDEKNQIFEYRPVVQQPNGKLITGGLLRFRQYKDSMTVMLFHNGEWCEIKWGSGYGKLHEDEIKRTFQNADGTIWMLPVGSMLSLAIQMIKEGACFIEKETREADVILTPKEVFGQ